MLDKKLYNVKKRTNENLQLTEKKEDKISKQIINKEFMRMKREDDDYKKNENAAQRKSKYINEKITNIKRMKTRCKGN